MVKLRDRVLLLGNSAKSDMKLTYHRKTAKPANSTKIGKQVGSDYLHNCLTCLKWPACKDPKKSANYRCSKYAEAVIEPTSIDELFKNPDANILNEEEIFARSGDDEESILDMISKVIDSNIPVPPDLRINDHEIPEAANFLQWATDDRFAKSGMPPFPRQVEIGLKIFSEFCPRCSDTEWFEDMPVDAPIAEIQDRVQVLEFGICPKCKTGKSEFLCNEELDNYYGVVGLAGQRCLVGNTLVTTTHGFKYIKDLKHPSYKKGFNKFKQPYRKGAHTSLQVSLENGFTQSPSDFFISDKETTYKVQARCGLYVEGTKDHPVMTENGFVKLGDITTNDKLLIQAGQNVWSDVDHVDANTAKLIGYVISEGHKVAGKKGQPWLLKITNNDENVLNFCMNQLQLLGYSPKIVRRQGKSPDITLSRISKDKNIEFYFGKFGVRSRNISTPDCILSSGKAVITSYLRGLFEGDGYVSTKHGTIHYCSLSRKLINEIQVMLLNLGIFSTVYKKNAVATNGNPGNNTSAYVLDICGADSLTLFSTEIGFDSVRKSKKLRRTLQKTMPFATDKLTYAQSQKAITVIHKIHDELQQYGISTRMFDIRLDRLVKREYGLSRISLINFVTKVLAWGRVNLLPTDIQGELYALKAEHTSNKYYDSVASVEISTKKKTTYDFTIPKTHRFMANGILNHNSAKTTSVILWDSYDLHHTLKLPSPQTVYGILDTTPITSTYAATTFAQAVDNVWTPYKSTLNDTPWFKKYHKFLEKRGEELGEELFTLGEHMVRYRHRNIVLAPSGPNKRTMRGKSRRSGMVDEIGWFKLAKKTGKVGDELELMDAKGVFDALDNSLITLKNSHRMRIEEGYNTIPKPMMYIVSSPSQYNDFIMSAYRLYSNSPERYCFKYPTWDFNPLYKKKHFKEAYKLRPVETARDFECNPPIGEGLFITDHASLMKSFNTGPNKIQIETKTALSKTKNRMTTASVRITSNSLPTYGTILCVDVGIVNNSFSFAIIGPPDDYDGELLPEERGTMQVPARVYAMGEVIPKAGTRISLTSIYTECFIPLIEPFNIMYFVSDRWQNAKIAQDIEDGYEVTPMEHKCSWEDFETTRDLLYSGNLQMPRLTDNFDDILKTTLDNYPECFRNRPVDHLAWQFATVREQTGVTVLKGDGGTDDSFRTIVLGVAQLQNEEILEELLSVTAQQETKKDEFLGFVVKVNSNGASSATSSDGSALGAVKRFSR